MLDSLHSLHSLPDEYGRQAHGMVMNPILNRGIHYHVAMTNSALLGLQPEDWLNMQAPVNVPGTTHEIYPNWRRKLSCSLHAMFHNPEVTSLLTEIDRRRRYDCVIYGIKLICRPLVWRSRRSGNRCN